MTSTRPPAELSLRSATGLCEELWLNLSRAAASAGHELEVGLRPFGLSPTQLNVLRILREAGDSGLCQYEIGARLVAQVPDVPRIIDRMERAGWVQRERGLTDRRLVMAKLTERGHATVRNLDSTVSLLVNRLFTGLSSPQLERLNELLLLARTSAAGVAGDLAEDVEPAACADADGHSGRAEERPHPAHAGLAPAH